jgi:hypothetical protein
MSTAVVQMARYNRHLSSTQVPKVITLCASMDFIDSIKQWKACLRDNGYEVYTPHLVDHRRSKKPQRAIFALKRKEEARHFEKIKRSDAVLVLNYTKNGFANYLGGAAFAEVAIATYLNKKAYVANPIPVGMPYTEELLAWGVEVWKGPRPIEGSAS